MQSLTTDLLTEFDRQISLFSSIPKTHLSQLCVEYYTCLQCIVVYVSSNMGRLDHKIVEGLKNRTVDVMNELLSTAESQDDSIYLEMAEMTKETYDGINMLCEAIANMSC